MMKLNLDLIPSSSFYQNVRKILTKSQWSAISNQVRSEAYDICRICNSSSEPATDCHEVWFYDEHTLTQKLVKLEALCKRCHGVKHYGFSQLRGKEKETLQHMMKVNGITKKQAETAVNKSFQVWEQRSQKQWKLDISLLSEYNIDVSKIKL